MSLFFARSLTLVPRYLLLNRAETFHLLALVSFLAQPKAKIPFLSLSLLRKQTEMLATQAIQYLTGFLRKTGRSYEAITNNTLQTFDWLITLFLTL